MSKQSSSSGAIFTPKGIHMLRSYWKFQYPAADLVFALIVTPVVLKLMGYIDWSWWYVTLPFWGGAAVVLGVLLIAFLFAAVAEIRRR